MPGRGTVFGFVCFAETIKEADYAQAVESMAKENMLQGKQFEEWMEAKNIQRGSVGEK